MYGHDIGLLKQSFEANPFDVGGEIAINQVGVMGDHSSETIACDMRKALADAPQTQHADGQITDPANHATRGVVPLAGFDGAIVQRDVSQQIQGHRQRVGRDLADTIVGRIGNPDSVARGCRRIDRIEPCSITASNADVRAGEENGFADFGVLNQESIAVNAGRDHLVCSSTLGNDGFDSGIAIQRKFQVEIRKIMVSD